MVRLPNYSRTYLLVGLVACISLLLSTLWIRAHPQRPQLWRMLSEKHSLPDGSLDSIMNETLGFQKIFVLNLQKRTDRRDLASLAAASVGVKLNFVDGVTEFDMKAAPTRLAEQQWQGFDDHLYLSWRAHVNAIRTVVEQNLTTALIMEDDADFDVSIKEQLRDYARATRLLLQPVQGTDKSLDPTNPRKSKDDEPYEIDLENPEQVVTEPTSSPYGDIERWDVLWLGHCGQRPPPQAALQHPLGRVFKHDPTAIRPQHYLPLNGDKAIWPAMPNNTRLVFHAHTPGCNLAYAINRQSARKWLYQLGIQNMTGFSDIQMHRICNGEHIAQSEHIWKKRTCMGVLPPLFGHHFQLAYPRAFTENIRRGARANFEKLVDGDTDYYDAFPDEEPMALYFHSIGAKSRYERYQREPEKMRQEESDRRGIVKTQERLKQQQRGHS